MKNGFEGYIRNVSPEIVLLTYFKSNMAPVMRSKMAAKILKSWEKNVFGRYFGPHFGPHFEFDTYEWHNLVTNVYILAHNATFPVYFENIQF